MTLKKMNPPQDNVTKTSRTWCFTWNNFNPYAELTLQNSNFKLLCYGREVGESGTPHLQGVIVLNSPQRLSWLKQKYGSRPHWEICKNLIASIKYCQKDGDFFFKDNRKKRGPKHKEDPVFRDDDDERDDSAGEQIDRIIRKATLSAAMSAIGNLSQKLYR